MIDHAHYVIDYMILTDLLVFESIESETVIFGHLFCGWVCLIWVFFYFFFFIINIYVLQHRIKKGHPHKKRWCLLAVLAVSKGHYARCCSTD